MAADDGSVERASRGRAVFPIALVAAIAVSSIIIGLAPLSTPWTIVFQVMSAVAGAALGNALRLDQSRGVIRNQARPATRHLFDQVNRLRSLVQRAESYGVAVTAHAERGEPISTELASEWFTSMGSALRDEIDATAASIEHWGDLVPTVRNQEESSYRERASRLPTRTRSDGA